jgi:5-methyltetrahydrofolate--homocysteine methyltransferase
MSALLEALHSGRVLVMDGAMGTELQRLALADPFPERAEDARDRMIRACNNPAVWNLCDPERVARVHCAYLEAGADVLVTNTFQANIAALIAASLEHELERIWGAAIRSARLFRDPAPFVLGDIGPVKAVTETECRTLLAYCRNTDGVLLETWSAEQEQYSMFSAVNRKMAGLQDLPLLLSFTYFRNLVELARVAAAAAQAAVREGADAIGANCGRDIDMDDLLEIVQVYRQETSLPIFIRPNAGTPRAMPTGGYVYPRSPQEMADGLWPLLEAGVTMVGGCCGTTPAHIAAFRRVVDEWNARK